MKASGIVVLLSLFSTTMLSSQDSLQVKQTWRVRANGNLQITDNGVSLFPNLSLGRPAAVLNVNVLLKNFSFEPEMRWGLNGDPWSYIFWFRYRINKVRFQLRTGLHPAYVLSEQEFMSGGNLVSRFVATRYLAGELAPSFQFTPHFAMTLHYLHSRASDDYGVDRSNFFSLQARLTRLGLTGPLYLNFFPQLFYLQLGEKAGLYVSESISLNHKKWPVYVSSLLTYKIDSTIPGDRLVSSFGLNIKF